MIWLLSLLSIFTFVQAHGYVEWLILDDKNVTSYLPYFDPWQKPPKQRITRAFVNNGFVDDVEADAIGCNSMDENHKSIAAPSQYSADVTAGSTVKFHWTDWPESHHGPVMTYMADCQGNCATFQSNTKNAWFKIDEAGFDNGDWAADVITNTSNWESTIPASLAPGQYLIRHEIIALHAAHEKNGAQFYMQCFQVNLRSSGIIKPKGDASFPGTYQADDPGISLNIYYPKVTSYTIPGPPLFDGSSSGHSIAQEEESSPSSTSKPRTSRVSASTGRVTSPVAPSESSSQSNKGSEQRPGDVDDDDGYKETDLDEVEDGGEDDPSSFERNGTTDDSTLPPAKISLLPSSAATMHDSLHSLWTIGFIFVFGLLKKKPSNILYTAVMLVIECIVQISLREYEGHLLILSSLDLDHRRIPMLPLGLLHAANGKPMLVELKNGETFNGHMVACDNFMNITIKDVYQTSADGVKFWKMAEAYVRGNNIKYVRVADNVLDQVKEQEAEARARGAHRGGSANRGGGSGRGGANQSDRGGRGGRGGGDRGRGRGNNAGRGRGMR